MTQPAPALRDRLLEEARALLTAEGIEAVGIREVARRAKVSHGAPRRHFASRELLLATLAVEGFTELEHEVQQIVARAGTPRTKIESAALAYVTFAGRNPALFALMFRHDLLEGSGANLRSKTLPLLSLFGELMGAAGGDTLEPETVIALWTAIHGIAVLSASRGLDILSPRPSDRLLVEQQVERHLRSS